MLGAILGDIVGSPFEFDNFRSTEFPFFSTLSRFTDDTVLTAATAVKLMDGGTYAERYKEFYRLYPESSYGARFHVWGSSESLDPYNSFGNGAAMRVSPIGWAFDDLEEALEEARMSASATHDHPEGIKGAQATVACIVLARTGTAPLGERRTSIFLCCRCQNPPHQFPIEKDCSRYMSGSGEDQHRCG